MLVKIRWILKVLLALLVLAVFHYNLPQRDIVRITGTEILRKDLSGWTGMFYAAAQSGESRVKRLQNGIFCGTMGGATHFGRSIPMPLA